MNCPRNCLSFVRTEALTAVVMKKEHVAPICFLTASYRFLSLAHSSTLKMEATCSSEMSVDFQRTTSHHIPEDRTLLVFF
jgi:hypothetical protein